MLDIQKFLRAKRALESAPVPDPVFTFANRCIVEGYCMQQGIPYAPDSIGSMMICDMRVYIIELQKPRPGDDRIIECLTSSS